MPENQLLKSAIWYAKHGYSVIPCSQEKKALVKWEAYQKEQPTLRQVEEWWEKFPDANIALITGKISNLTVLDADTEEAKNLIESYLPETFLTPIVKSPKGHHYYFTYQQDIPNKANISKGLDARSEGGYIIAPPSKNGNGKEYQYLVGINNVAVQLMPSSLFSYINSKLKDYIYTKSDDKDNMRQHETTSANISFNKGARDQTLFHVANCLVKGGMPEHEIEQLLTLIASKVCNPPFPKNELLTKVQSALKREDLKSRNLTEEIRNLIKTTSGNITTTFANNFLGMTTRDNMKKVYVIFGRLVEEGLLERTGKRAGEYRIKENRYEVVDFDEVNDETFDIKLPFGLEDFIEIMPKDLIAFAGTPNSGKTALCLETARLNKEKKVFYFSSEMNRNNVKKRIAKHDSEPNIKNWGFKFIDEFPNWLDIIHPDDINILDYLEAPDGDFFKMPSILADIQKRLKGGIAIVALQKKTGIKWAAGGELTLAKPALFCTIDPNPPYGAKLRIEKAKNYRSTNPKDYAIKFHIFQGINVKAQDTWMPELV